MLFLPPHKVRKIIELTFTQRQLGLENVVKIA